VFECNNGLANNVITTIGQAFELRFKKFLNSIPSTTSATTTAAINNKNSPESVNSPPQSVLKEHKSNALGGSGAAINHHQYHHHNGGSSSVSSSSNNNQQPQHHKQSPSSINSNNNNNNNHMEIPTKKFNPSSAAFDSSPSSPQHHHQLHHHHNRDAQPPLSSASKGLPSVASSASKVDEKLERMPWFHGLLTREYAEKMLLKDGDYLVRETNKANRQYVLSGRYKGECRHIFLVDPSGVVRTKDRVFENICHLIKYHQDNNIPIISKDNELLLENPIHK
jgi:hypothetical protein